MAKQSGLGDQLFIGGYDIGGDIQSIGSLSTPRTVLDSTGITKSAMERLAGQRDASGEFTSFFNKATGQQHLALRGLPRTDVHLMYLRGTTRGNQGLALVGKQVNYDLSRPDDGSLTFGVSVQSSLYGADWCAQLTAGKQTDAAAGSSASVDLGAIGTAGSTAFGFQAYLQVFSIGSGTATVTIETSSDNGVTDPWAALTGGAFTNVIAQTVERIQSASDTLTVERYVRVTTSGVFTNLVFAVAINKNQAVRAI